MRKICNIRTFNTGRFTVSVDAMEEDCPDFTFDETGEVAEKVESGEYVIFCARARVLLDGNEIASDYLGNCIYGSFAEFEDHRECGAQTRKLRESGSKAIVGSYFADMVRNVCREARQEVKRLQSVKVRA